MSENLSHLPRELHGRTSAGIQVSLWWSPADCRTRVPVRDVRSADYLEVEKYPTMSYRSTGIRRTDDGGVGVGDKVSISLEIQAVLRK
jgi:polyisoprenoid-binding protein YceI